MNLVNLAWFSEMLFSFEITILPSFLKNIYGTADDVSWDTVFLSVTAMTALGR